ncbi:MAG TPA: response regulator transcription factor [Symbiobacteriaceae bacterium]|nr:response regulator transcription factor [Symbiobacteriaceae bacterium]
MAPLVLVVEDDAMLSDVLRMYLEKEGYEVKVIADGLDGLTQALVARPALVVLDVMLPRLDGWEIIRQLREVSEVPIILLTARGEEADKLMGFDLGADDYLAKPFSMQEFLARARALLKRSGGMPKAHRQPAAAPAAPAPMEGVLTFPTLLIDERRHRVERNGKQIPLTPKEFDLLIYLANRPGTVVRRDELLQEIWGYSPSEDDRTIHTHINRLRAKLEGQDYHYIHTVWGIGYKFEVTRQ